MYRVLVCEDEYIIRKGLIFSIDWAKHQCCVIGEAENGEEGIQKILELQPDIIIADINMPICNGLQMIEETYEKVNYSIIILSGYNDFDFAMKAIKFGVSEYLLKPVEESEMEKALDHAIAQVEMRALYQKQLLHKEDVKSIRIIEPVQFEAQDMLVQRMVDYINENYANKIVMHDLSDKLNYSETLLNKRFKDAFGTTFNDYLNKVRIQKAIDAMQSTNKYVYEIANECGFKDYKYFSIVFKKYLGCSPKEFLKALQG